MTVGGGGRGIAGDTTGGAALFGRNGSYGSASINLGREMGGTSFEFTGWRDYSRCSPMIIRTLNQSHSNGNSTVAPRKHIPFSR
jgi:hypothetical protein